MTKNEEFSRLLEQVASVYQVLEGGTFRTRAYQNASVAIANLATSIEELYRNDLLNTIPGVGKSIKEYLIEFLEKGRVKHFEREMKRVPAGMFPLMEVRGIGPITAYKIAKHFKLEKPGQALKMLEKIIKKGEITEIAGFREKTLQKLKKALAVKATGKGRITLFDARKLSASIIAHIQSDPQVTECTLMGSARRHSATVGDIDIGFASDNPSESLKRALNHPEIVAIITSGESVAHVKLASGFEADIKSCFLDEWGSLLQHYTGSKMHNIHLRKIAQKKHLSLSEYGIKTSRGLVKFDNEKNFYKYLGLSYIPPELREDIGEIEYAENHKYFDLLELSQIKGDLHIHSDFQFPSSHDLGISAVFEIYEKALDLGYEYIGISDHNPTFTGLSLSEKRKILQERNNYLKSKWESYEKQMKKRKIKLLIGLEVDIRTDGSLALEDELFEYLDYSIASIHSGFSGSVEENTERLIKAISNPHVTIIGHPTTRMLNHREVLPADWSQIFAECAKKNKILEINAYPTRLDLPDDLLREANKSRCHYVINTDSHEVDQMELMTYGVGNARRGWVSPKQVVNTLSCKVFQNLLN